MDIRSPYRKWNRINGLEGVVIDIIRFNNIVYAATNCGVYYLEQDNDGFLQFKRIPEINVESWSLLEFLSTSDHDSRLLVGTNEGIFEITNKSGKLLKPKGIVYALYQSTIAPERLFVGYTDGIGAFEFNEKKNEWKFLGKNDSINNCIKSSYEG